jgi:carbon storage regulator
MLILTRRFEEGIRIGDDIHVVVLGINGNQVRIGIQAPRELVVLRDEVYERQQAERGRGRDAAPGRRFRAPAELTLSVCCIQPSTVDR